MTAPFAFPTSDEIRRSVLDAVERLGMIPHVTPVTATVSQGNAALVARLLDTSRTISPEEFAEIERMPT